MPDLLQLENIHIAYGKTPVIQNVNLNLEKGMIVALLGGSGCGKTTLLRAIAGFQAIQKGTITLNNHIISQPKNSLAPEKRGIGMVFQDYALFPHLSVAQNIAFGLRKQRKKIRRQRVKALLKLINLAGYEKRYPHELSGGQQQRIALARALAPHPKLLLLDEPFGSQDVELRETLAKEVRTILLKEGITAILVTHDQHEAFAMADKIGILNQGKLVQWDTGYQLYHRPINQFVADFIGQGVLLAGEVINDYQVKTALGLMKGNIPIGCRPNCLVDVLIRPDDIRLDPSSHLKAKIIERTFRGAEFQYTLQLHDKSKILALVPSHQKYKINDEMGLKLDVEHLVVFKS